MPSLLRNFLSLRSILKHDEQNLFRIVDKSAKIHDSAKIWAFSQVRDKVQIHDNAIISNQVYIGSGVTVGKNCKIQNNAMIYEPAVIDDGVFIGPGVILTNDLYPRAINPDGSQKEASDWDSVGVKVRFGASIGAGSVCIAPIVIGEWAVVAAGSVVTKDVKSFALVAGVPARQIGWVGKLGIPLKQLSEREFICPNSDLKYSVNIDGELEEIK